MEPEVIKYVYGEHISFFLSRAGKTFRVGCVTSGVILQRSRHRSQSAAEKSLNLFVNEWNTLMGGSNGN